MLGFDWGSRSACIAAALWPKRVRGVGLLAPATSFRISPRSMKPADARKPSAATGTSTTSTTSAAAAGLEQHRHAAVQAPLATLVADLALRATRTLRSSRRARSTIPISSRCRCTRTGTATDSAPGDPAVEDTERRLTALPSITVPAIALHRRRRRRHASRRRRRNRPASSEGPYEAPRPAGVGHNLPQEAPQKFADAVLVSRQGMKTLRDRSGVQRGEAARDDARDAFAKRRRRPGCRADRLRQQFHRPYRGDRERKPAPAWSSSP